MTRGNQRDTDRAKAQKKLAQQNKSKKNDSGVSHKNRAENDAEIMRAKQAAKEATKAAAGGVAPPQRK